MSSTESDSTLLTDFSDESSLQRERRKWSRDISVVCYVGLITCLVACVFIVVLVAIPGVIGYSHKDYIAGILSLFFLCIIFLLYKARDDSRSLIFISITAIGFGCLVIGFGGGQLIRKTST